MLNTLIPTRKGFTTKPPYGACVARSDGVGQGLMDAFVFGSGAWLANQTEKSVCSDSIGTYVGNAVSKATRFGVGPAFDGSDDTLVGARGYTHANGTLVFCFDQILALSNKALCSQNSSSNGWDGLGIETTSGNYTFYSGGNGGSNVASFGQTAGETVLLAGRWDAVSGNSLYHLDSNGRTKNSTTTYAQPNLSATYKFDWGSYNYSGGRINYAGIVPHFGLVYNRVLTDSEILQLWQEPYCFLRPARRPLYLSTVSAPSGNRRRRLLIGS